MLRTMLLGLVFASCCLVTVSYLVTADDSWLVDCLLYCLLIDDCCLLIDYCTMTKVWTN